MFDCPSCKQETKKLIAIDQTIYCSLCYEKKDQRPTYLHQRMPGAESRRLTVAKAGVIANRVISRESKNKTVVLDRRTGKPTEY
jgi:hypothetical protein